MKLNFLLHSVLIYSFLFSSLGNCMEAPARETEESLSIRAYLPADSSEDYVKKVSQVRKSVTSASSKAEIQHDRPLGILMPGVVTEDYGWNFPSIPRVQNELLEFCAIAFPSSSRLRMIDVGAGFGHDTIMMLLTMRAHVTAFEKPKSQFESLKSSVYGSIQTKVDQTFPIGERFTLRNNDFLTSSFAPMLKGIYDGINANKVVHFFDPEQTLTFVEKSAFLLKTGGRLFLTCLTPTPESMIEQFMSSQKDTTFPGYIFYKQENKLDDSWTQLIKGSSKVTEVRRPSRNEKSAHFLQTVRKEKRACFAVTERVMHYHTEETLEKALGSKFKIVKTIYTTPEENFGIDHMISIVAERLE